MIITYLIAFGIVIGALDHLAGNRLKLGERFTSALEIFPTLFIIMGGMLAIVPTIAWAMHPLGRLVARIGIDAGMLPGVLLANDQGAFHLAHQLTSDPRLGDFNGILIGSLLGAHLTGSLPLVVTLTDRRDHPILFRGILCGILTIPAGAFVGGLAAGYPLRFVFVNMLPLLIATAILAFLFRTCTQAVIRATIGCGKVFTKVATIAIVAEMVAALTGHSRRCAAWLMPMEEIAPLLFMVILILPGAYVVAELAVRATRRPFAALAPRLGLDATSMAGMTITLANPLPVFPMLAKMNPLGKILACAVLPGGAYAIADHLAFCQAVAPRLIAPMIAGKVAAALAAATLAWMLYHKNATRLASEEQSPAAKA